MNVRLLPMWTVALLFIVGPAFSTRAELPTPPEISQAAAVGLPSFLSRVPPGEEADYGFANAEEARRGQLAQPFRLHAITPTALRAWRPGDSPSSLLSETDMWYFPITVDGVVRSILVVDQTPAGWEAVSLGYASLAAALDGLRQDWPEKDGCRPLLAVSFQAREYLFTLPGHPEPNLTPLRLIPATAGRRATGTTHDLLDPGTMVGRLLPMVERNLAEFSPSDGGAR